MADTAPKPFAFVLMPFEDAFLDVYKLGIKPACESVGMYCERVDEQIFQKETILTRIYNQIAKADVIIADMTGRNPNVFYEVGYAHALGKQVILLTQDSEDIPFDLKHYSHIVYSGSIAFLKDEILKRVKWVIDNPEKALETADQRLRLYLNGIELVDNPRIGGATRDVNFGLKIHNPTLKSFAAGAIQIGLIGKGCYNTYGSDSIQRRIRLPDGKALFDFGTTGRLFPSAWETLKVDISVSDFATVGATPEQYKLEDSEDFVFRIFTELGTYDYPFSVFNK